MVKLALGCVIAYLIGSFSTAVWVGKWFFKKDVREHGSKNAGATNALRVLGRNAGIMVLLIDVFKAYLAVKIIPMNTAPDLSDVYYTNYQLILGIFAVLGHIFPLYTGFKGGKGVASWVGVALALYPAWTLVSLVMVFATAVYTTRYVSVGSILAAFFFPILSIWIFPPQTYYLKILSIFIGVFVIIMHHKNIKRLINKQENKFF